MKFALIFILAIAFAGFGASKRIELYRLNPRQVLTKDFIPVYSSMHDFAESLVEEKPEDANLVLFKPFKNSVVKNQEFRSIEPTVEDSGSSGRTFKHFLLLKSLMNSGFDNNYGGYGSGYNGGHKDFSYPIFINTPLNLTNINNNNATVTPAAAAAAAGGAAGGAAGALDDLRINFIGLPQQQWPMQMQMPMQNIKMPTEVYQQREASTTFPSYTVAMLNMPGLPPLPITQYVSDNNYRKQQRKVFKWPNGYNRGSQNPIAAFANNFRGIQFL